MLSLKETGNDGGREQMQEFVDAFAPDSKRPN